MSDLRQDALALLRAALQASNAGNAVRRHFKMPEGAFDRVVLCAIGKAAFAMAEAVAEKVPKLGSILVVSKHGHARPAPPSWRVWEAGHPIPDESSFRAAQAVRAAAADLGARDLLIVAVSGGASALLSAPVSPITLADKQATTELLLRAGADIGEFNSVRKHISTLKGGGLAAVAYPATVLALLLSDVVGDPPAVIGSGLTVPDPTTYQEAVDVLERYGVTRSVPLSVRHHLGEGASGRRPETPKPGDPVFERVTNMIVGSNALAVQAAAAAANECGYRTVLLPSEIQGEAKHVAERHVARLKEEFATMCSSGDARPLCILSGGETTVTVRGEGKGGRNQEFALAAATPLHGWEEALVLSAGTDGTDGPTDAAGALATSDTVSRARWLGLDVHDYLQRNDSYHFFERLDDLVKTGPTDTNVMDIHIMLARKS